MKTSILTALSLCHHNVYPSFIKMDFLDKSKNLTNIDIDLDVDQEGIIKFQQGYGFGYWKKTKKETDPYWETKLFFSSPSLFSGSGYGTDFFSGGLEPEHHQPDLQPWFSV